MKILFLTHRLPYAPDRGDRIRSYHLLRALLGFAEVHLFSLAEPEELLHLGRLAPELASVTTATPSPIWNRVRAIGRLPGRTPLTHLLLDAPGAQQQLAALAQRIEPDVVFAFCSGMARFALNPPLDRFPCVLDMVDVDSQKWKLLAATAKAPLKWIYAREGRTLRSFEALACKQARLTLVVNERERDILEAIAPTRPIHVLANGVDLDYFRPVSPQSTPNAGVVFCGVMDYQPNVDGVLWFAREVWPLIRAQHPTATFTIVGARPSRSIQKLHGHAGITCTGTVADVRPFIWNAAVSVAPLFLARGVQNKVLEALAAGLPVVTTSSVADGLPASVLAGCRVSDQPPGYAAAVSELLAQPADARRKLADRADLAPLTWASRLSVLSDLMAAAARSRE